MVPFCEGYDSSHFYIKWVKNVLTNWILNGVYLTFPPNISTGFFFRHRISKYEDDIL